MTELLKEIVPIGVLLTFIGTLISIFYTRKNLTTSKYIDTITSERIKWIESLRTDLSVLTSWTTIYANNKKSLLDLNDQYEELWKHSTYDYDLETRVLIGEQLNDEANINLTKQKELKTELDSITRGKVIEKINLIKLRLNPIDDKVAIGFLDNLMHLFLSNEITKTEITDMELKIVKFVELSQGILKAEWEKVKRETINGE